jgi:hypothetical protein
MSQPAQRPPEGQEKMAPECLELHVEAADSLCRREALPSVVPRGAMRLQQTRGPAGEGESYEVHVLHTLSMYRI